MPFSKADMISTLAKEGGVTKEKASTMLDALTSDIARALATGEVVDLHRFGRFTPYARGERKGRNLQSGQPMTIAPRTAVRFAPAPHLKACLNPGPSAVTKESEAKAETGKGNESPGVVEEDGAKSAIVRKLAPRKQVETVKPLTKPLSKPKPVK